MFAKKYNKYYKDIMFQPEMSKPPSKSTGFRTGPPRPLNVKQTPPPQPARVSAIRDQSRANRFDGSTLFDFVGLHHPLGSLTLVRLPELLRVLYLRTVNVF